MKHFYVRDTGRHCWLADGLRSTPTLFPSRPACEQYRLDHPSQSPFVLVAMSTARAYRINRLRHDARKESLHV